MVVTPDPVWGVIETVVSLTVAAMGAGGYYVVRLLIDMAVIKEKITVLEEDETVPDMSDKLDSISESLQYVNQRLAHIEHQLDIKPPKRTTV